MSARVDRDPVRSASAPLSRLIIADEVPDDGLDIAIEADPAECAAVASQISLPSIGALAARFRVERRSGGRLHVDGEVRATVTQMCVVSLDPFQCEIKQPVEIDFARQAPAPTDRDGRTGPGVSRRRRVELPVAPPAPVADEDDPPDPIVDGRIDLGVVAVEFLTLGIDFYPKKPGIQFTETVVGETDAPKPSAFAALERLKDRT